MNLHVKDGSCLKVPKKVPGKKTHRAEKYVQACLVPVTLVILPCSNLHVQALVMGLHVHVE